MNSTTKADQETRNKAAAAIKDRPAVSQKGPVVSQSVRSVSRPAVTLVGDPAIADALTRLEAAFNREGNLHPFKVLDAFKEDIALVSQAKGFFYLEDRFGMTRGCISAWNKSRKMGIKTPSRSSFKSEPPAPAPAAASPATFPGFVNEDKYLDGLTLAEKIVYWRARAEALAQMIRIITIP